MSPVPYLLYVVLSYTNRQELIHQVIDGLTTEQEDHTGLKLAPEMSFVFDKRVTNHENKEVFDRAMQLAAEKIKVRAQSDRFRYILKYV